MQQSASKRLKTIILAFGMVSFLVASGLNGPQAEDENIKIFDGHKKIIVVNGYSTSFTWPKTPLYFGP